MGNRPDTRVLTGPEKKLGLSEPGKFAQEEANSIHPSREAWRQPGWDEEKDNLLRINGFGGGGLLASD